MTNVKTEKKGQVLTITIDLNQPGTPSKNGKSLVIASTEGNVKIDPDQEIYLGLNLYKKR